VGVIAADKTLDLGPAGFPPNRQAGVMIIMRGALGDRLVTAGPPHSFAGVAERITHPRVRGLIRDDR